MPKLLTLKVAALLGVCLGTSLLAGELHAAPTDAPSFSAAPCCQLCPEAQDPNNYTTRLQDNFKTLMRGQGDWLFRSIEDLRTDFSTTAEGYRRLQQLHDAFKAHGIEVVAVYQPTRGLVERNYLLPADRAAFDYPKALKSYQEMLGHLAKMGYHTPDLSPLTNESTDHPEQDFYFRGDHHWTAYGAERTARIVAETIKAMPEYKGIPKREFETHMSGRLSKNGTLHDLAAEFCGTSYATEYVNTFATQPKAEATGDELFGDAPLPQITLVGTSHSARFYNFDGFLKQYTHADLLNVACAGCGFEGSMVEYLGSQEFREHPPKIIVWEFSSMYRLDQESVYRQILALLDKGCDGNGTEMAQSATLAPNTRTDLLINGKTGMHDWGNATHLIDIRFADPTVKTLHATLWYLNGRHEEVRFDKPTSIETNGRFSFELRDDGDWAGQTVLALEMPGPQIEEKDNNVPTVTASVDPVERVVHVSNPAPPPPPPALVPQQVDVKICKRNGYPNMSQSTAQAGL